MKFWMFTLMALVGIHSAIAAAAQTAGIDSKESQEVLDRLQGYWLNKEIVEKLKVTKGPTKSLGARYWGAFEIAKEKDSYKWTLIINFHEGVKLVMNGLKAYKQPNIFLLTISSTTNSTDTFTLDRADGAQQIIWNHQEAEPKESNRYVPKRTHEDVFVRLNSDFEHFVNHLVLAGTYQDPQGRIYQFTEDLQAKWPDRQFAYQLLLDGAMGNDVLMGTDILYKWEKDQLLLFHYRGDEEDGNYSVDKEPFLVLTRNGAVDDK